MMLLEVSEYLNLSCPYTYVLTVWEGGLFMAFGAALLTLALAWFRVDSFLGSINSHVEVYCFQSYCIFFLQTLIDENCVY